MGLVSTLTHPNTPRFCFCGILDCIHLLNPQPQIIKTIHVHSQSTAQRALHFSHAVRQTLLVQQCSAKTEIVEMEEYLGFLRAKMALIEAQVAEADEQIGVIWEVLDQHQISEGSLFRNDEPNISASSSSVESDDYSEPLTSDDSVLWNTGDLTAFTTDSLSQGLKSV